MTLYSIYDVKSEVFGSLAECRSDGEAIRSFLVSIQNAPNGSLLQQFPVDFALFRIGDFDDIDGTLLQDSAPVQLITGLEVLKMLKCKDNTCSEVAVRETSDESNVVNIKSTEEEVNVS